MKYGLPVTNDLDVSEEKKAYTHCQSWQQLVPKSMRPAGGDLPRHIFLAWTF
jgi:hypothetical protein